MGIRQFLSVTHGLPIALLASTVAPVAVAQVQQWQPSTVRVPDGGTSGRMQSIFVPPKPGAPFSLTLHTEWSRPMGNGGTYTLTNDRHIVRDRTGRIYQERWGLVPMGGTIKSAMDIFQITDPNQHTWFNCMTTAKVCDLYRYHLTAEEKFEPPTGPTGSLPDGTGFRQHEDLGASNTEGIDTHGYRESITINTGVMGNDRPMVTTREFWYSPHLAINLISIVDTPETGKQIFTAKEISTSEPDPAFFEIPAEYKVVDRRNEHN
jgi:hypothetical protein